MTYWQFAAERQVIYFRRLASMPPPWTQDPILQEFRFTNAYRAADRVSQYLIRHVIYGGTENPADLFFRILLFKLFNRIETWELLENTLGPPSFSTYRFDEYDQVLASAIAKGQAIYSSAYIMPSAQQFGYPRKHQNALKLLEFMMKDELPHQVSSAPTMEEVFELLRAYSSLGDFLAYQLAIDINYSPLTDFSEDDFVVAGPGARDGIAKCFADTGGMGASDVIRLIATRQEEEFARLGVDFQTLWGRPLQLIDCQNLFCEVDKYARAAHPGIAGTSGRHRIKRRYRLGPTVPDPWFPPDWEINSRDLPRSFHPSADDAFEEDVTRC